MKEFEIRINEEKGILYVEDDGFYISRIKKIQIKESIMWRGDFAIRLITDCEEIELYYHDKDKDKIIEAYDKLKLAICEYKRNRDIRELN